MHSINVPPSEKELEHRVCILYKQLKIQRKKIDDMPEAAKENYLEDWRIFQSGNIWGNNNWDFIRTEKDICKLVEGQIVANKRTHLAVF